jgi:hypothetical protein
MSSLPNSSANAKSGLIQSVVSGVKAIARWIVEFDREMRLVHEAVYKNLESRRF